MKVSKLQKKLLGLQREQSVLLKMRVSYISFLGFISVFTDFDSREAALGPQANRMRGHSGMETIKYTQLQKINITNSSRSRSQFITLKTFY
jgi:hypothetical protein